MARTPTPTLALILAGGLATGLALARPASPVPLPTDGSAPTATGGADPAVPSRSDRGGNRYAGARGGQAANPAPAPTPGGQAASSPATVTIEGFAFDGPVAVAAGTSLAVTNLDGVAHTLSFQSGGTDTGTIGGGATTTVAAPATPGTYAFICRIHPSMRGEIDITG